MAKTTVDIGGLYGKCLSGNPADIITARTVYNYCVSPFMVFCNKFAPQDKKDPPNEYNNLLFEQGRPHEKQVIENNYPDLKTVKYATFEEGFKLLLEAMGRGAPVAAGMPVFYLPEAMSGVVDVLEKRQGQNSVFGNYHYIIKEIKLARNIRKEHIYQAAFYNYVIGKIQGFTPPSFYLINRDMEETEQKFVETELLAMIQDIREILGGKKVIPTYNTCIWPWQTYNNDEAVRSRDVSLVAGVGQSTKRRLIARNINTIEHLAKESPQNLTSVEGIGEKTAAKLQSKAAALASGKHLRLGCCKFPEKKTELFLDLEGTGEQVQDEGLIAMDYLIGLLARSKGKEEYVPFVAHKVNQEKEMFSEFLKFVAEQEDYVIYHWHNYERTHVERLIERYGFSHEAEPILDSMRDLYKDAVANFAFPTYGNGLKEIAAYIGYKWKHADVNAMESIAMYFEYVKDPYTNRGKLEKVIDYNRDDCKATMLIKDWLDRESKK
ncbi:MAG: TM0106 family RecB-like putative nuclease [Candidatus Bathyarchaeia archaeon]|jgi:uncharacterized protein